jgi:hypothetical protein
MAPDEASPNETEDVDGRPRVTLAEAAADDDVAETAPVETPPSDQETD